MSISNAEREQIIAISGKILPSPSAAILSPIGETMPRSAITTVTSIQTLTSATLYLVGVSLPKGALISSISFLSGTTAEAVGTHLWYALYDLNRVLLGQSADNTAAAALAASTLFTQNLVTPFTTTYSGLYYLGICCVATTPPTLMGAISAVAATNIAPILSGSSSAGLLGSAPNPAAALTALAGIPYAFAA
jgi:hypothetical protein